jgi:hypothetical protein
MEGGKNRSLFFLPADGRRQEPFSLLIASVWKATRTGLFSYGQWMEGDKNRFLFLLPTDGRRQLVSLFIAIDGRRQEPVINPHTRKWRNQGS